MTDTVFCKLLQEELPRLDAPPFPGPKGEEIFRHYSAKAWQQWQDLQTMLINEKHLNMMDKAHRRYLTEQRTQFFAGADVDQAEGYTAPEL